MGTYLFDSFLRAKMSQKDASPSTHTLFTVPDTVNFVSHFYQHSDTDYTHLSYILFSTDKQSEWQLALEITPYYTRKRGAIMMMKSKVTKGLAAILS
ncbi:MAG: hypothetical protein J6D53_03230, partial [Blautia sp.]|nr:hypothetical protein [Blautia sp.]